MSGFVSFGGGGGGAPSNRSNPGEEYVGISSTDLTTFTCPASANTKSTYATLGTASGALWKGVTVVVGGTASPGGSGTQFLIDISFDGGSTTKIPNLFFLPSTTTGMEVYLPLSIQTSNTANAVQVRVQSSTASAPISVGIIGHLNTDNNSPPLWNNMVDETISTAGSNVHGSTITVGTGAGSYLALDASASQNFGAILPVASGNGTAIEDLVARFTIENNGGGAGTGSQYAIRPFYRNSIGAPFKAYGPVIYNPVNSTQQISCAVNAATGGGTVRVGFYGFY